MVLRLSIWRILTLFLLFYLLCSFQDPALTPGNVAEKSGVFPWIVNNWQTLALIVSEVSALISVKYSGIIKSVLTFLGTCIKKK
jgi:hypothetical protein